MLLYTTKQIKLTRLAAYLLQWGILSSLQKRLAPVEKLALSNYLFHSIVTSIILYGDGFAMYGMLQRYELYYIVAGI